MAFCLFMIAAALLLTAAMVDSLANDRELSEAFGLTGIICLEVCVICGVCYTFANKRPANENWLWAIHVEA